MFYKRLVPSSFNYNFVGKFEVAQQSRPIWVARQWPPHPGHNACSDEKGASNGHHTFLEEQTEALWTAGDDHWMCLLANWMIAAGCLRYRHLLRAEPRRISLSTFHGFCSKGKQKKQRSGFYFALPGHFAWGWPWSKHWLAYFSKLGETIRLCRKWTTRLSCASETIFQILRRWLHTVFGGGLRRWGSCFGWRQWNSTR